MRGDLTYVSKHPAGNLIWRLRHNLSDFWIAELTDAVPVGFEQPRKVNSDLDVLLRVLDNFVLESK